MSKIRLLIGLCIAIILAEANVFCAEEKEKGPDYIVERIAAGKLARSRKTQEALDAYLKMAETPQYSDFQKSDAFEQACLLARILKKYDQALEITQKIPMKPVSKACRILIYYTQREYQKIINEFKDEDFGNWPLSHIGTGYYYRGVAYLRLKDNEKALEDLKNAAEKSPGGSDIKGDASCALADIYLAQGEDEKALECYMKALSCFPNGRYTYFNALLKVVPLLVKMQKYDEASALIEKSDPAKMRGGHWKLRLLKAQGDIYLSKGEKEKALDKYKEAFSVKDGHSGDLKTIEKIIAEINNKEDTKENNVAEEKGGADE